MVLLSVIRSSRYIIIQELTELRVGHRTCIIDVRIRHLVILKITYFQRRNFSPRVTGNSSF